MRCCVCGDHFQSEYAMQDICGECQSAPASTPADRGHVLFKTGDADAPEVIKDRNGEVVLGLCRHCNKGEIELAGTCTRTPSVGGIIITRGMHQALKSLYHLHDEYPGHNSFRTHNIDVSGSTSAMLRRMEPAGLVKVDRHHGSRYYYSLTPAGREFVLQRKAVDSHASRE